MKKLISLLLTLVTVLTCLCTTAFADSAAKISFDKGSAANGDTVVLRFTMPETDAMKNMIALGIMLSYDPNAFEYVSMDGWVADAESGVVTANWMASNAVQGDDIREKMFTVTFRCIADTAATCDFEVAFDAENCYNSAFDAVSISPASGAVAVSSQPTQGSNAATAKPADGGKSPDAAVPADGDQSDNAADGMASADDGNSVDGIKSADAVTSAAPSGNTAVVVLAVLLAAGILFAIVAAAKKRRKS